MAKHLTAKLARYILPEEVYVRIRSVLTAPRMNRLFCQVKRQKEEKQQIVVIGDSHSRFFSGAEPDTEITVHSDKNGFINYDAGYDDRFCAFDLGPALAYNLNRKLTSVRAYEKYEFLSKNLMRKGECIICAFGEIDIRAHVFKHVSENRTYKDIVDVICSNYAEFLNKISEDGFFPAVWGPIASQKDEWIGEVPNPAVGGETERNMAVEYFNEKMRKICTENGWGFMTIYDKLMDAGYRTGGGGICMTSAIWDRMQRNCLNRSFSECCKSCHAEK